MTGTCLLPQHFEQRGYSCSFVQSIRSRPTRSCWQTVYIFCLPITPIFPNISFWMFVSMRSNVFPFHLKKRLSVALFIRNEGGWNALVRDECVAYHRHGRGTTQAWPVRPTQTLYVLTRALAHTATLHLVCITLRSNKEGGTVLSCCIAVLSYCIAALYCCIVLHCAFNWGLTLKEGASLVDFLNFSLSVSRQPSDAQIQRMSG